MTDTETNSALPVLAATLAEAKKGTFTGIIIQKQGEVRGGRRYGDDWVHAVIITGFSYPNLIRRSLEKLQAMDPAALVTEFAQRGIVAGNGDSIRLADVCKAICDLDASYMATLNGTNESTCDHVFDPLVVGGETVRGARVYKCVADTGVKCHCRNCSGDAKAPVPGQINLSGLLIGQQVLEAAPNGPVPASKSRADVVAKNIIRARLPVSRYVSYRLAPGADFLLRAGGTAALAASEAGVSTSSEKVAEILSLLVG